MTIREYPFPLLCLNRVLIQLQDLGILESVKEQKRNFNAPPASSSRPRPRPSARRKLDRPFLLFD